MTATASTTDSLDVSWSAPANAGKPAISGYEVQYRTGGGAWSSWPHSGPGTAATITGLEADTAYEVQVRATNADGSGEWSAPGSGRTNTSTNSAPEFASDAATLSVAENTAASTDIGAALTATDDDGDPLTYTLEGTDAASFAIVPTSGQVRTGAALDYETKSSYSVTVKAADGNGGSDTVAVTISVTDEDEPPAAPGVPTVTATASTTDSLDVSWSAPANAGKPAITAARARLRGGHRVRGAGARDQRRGAVPDRRRGLERWPHSGPGTAATITGLEADTSYQVQVRATNADGDSLWSAAGSGRTSAAAGPMHCDGTEVWCAAMTVGSLSSSFGYTSIGTAYGELTDTDFTLGGTYTVLGLVDSAIGGTQRVVLVLDTALGTNSPNLELHLDGSSLDFGDAAVESTVIRGVSVATYSWVGPSRNWSVNDAVAVEIRSLGPVLTIVAVNDNIPHGLGNARTAGVAEFVVTRSYVPPGETRDTRLRFSTLLQEINDPSVVLGFRHGQKTRTLAHFALDTDAQGDPICTITFVLQPGEGYLIGTPSEATVNVQGPGTTCMTDNQGSEEPLTASFDGFPPSHDGENPFSFRIAFSTDITASEAGMRDHALTVTAGDVTSAERVNQRADLWTFTVTPSGESQVSILLQGGRACSEAGAICTESGGRLTTGLARIVPFAAAAEEPEPLTASFTGVPAAHDGETAFSFRVAFSEAVGISYKTLRDESFTVTAGGVTRARRVDGSNKLWEITVDPDSRAAVAITLAGNRACGTAGAVCTREDEPRPLTNSPSATVAGPGSEPSAEGFELVPENSRPSGIWSDGETAWVADLEDARLYAYRRADGERQPDRDIATGPAPMGLWSDGETLWVAGLDGGLRAHRLSDGTRQAARDLALEASAAPAGVWSDGETAWVSEWLGGTVHAYRLADGRREAGRDIQLAGGNLLPAGVWSDGETLWVADWCERMYAYRLADGGREPGRDIDAGAADTDPTGLWSGGGTLLSTGWESGDVRAFRLPAAPRTQDALRAAGPGAGLAAIADPALRAAVAAALGKQSGEAASAEDLAGLESLKARNAGIRDLSGLEGAVGLKELDLGFNPLADLRPLASLPALESLNLDGAGPDLGALAPLAGLRRLSLRHNGIDDLGPLAGLFSLAELDVGDNRVEDLRPLAGLAGLRVLKADRNRIANLWPLASLAGLEALELGANRVRDLQPLAGLARLGTLRLAGNGLAELHPLSGLEGLRDLGLAGNAVEDLRALAHLDGLRRLDLRGNAVGDLRPLRALRSLVWVHVGGSGIEDLAPLEGLPGLAVEGRDDRAPPDAFGGRAGRVRRD